MEKNNNLKIAMKVSWLAIFCNFLLMILKLLAGIFSNSYAMISDGVHTASDVFSTFIVMIGVKISSKGNDKKHEYGHERFECVSAIILSIMLLATGLIIGYVGITKIINNTEIVIPGFVALIAAFISILVKEIMFHITIKASKKINSSALKADAWHHRSDALSSIGSLVGIGGAMLGFPILDAISSLVICLFIIKASVSIFLDSIRKMTDEACDETTEEEIKILIDSCEGVIKIDNLRTRRFGDKIYVNVNICVNENLNLKNAHEIAHIVEASVETNISNVKECFVHVNPC